MQPLDFLGTAIVIIGGTLVLMTVRFLFNRSIRKASNNSFPYYRKLVTFVIVLIGVFLAVGLLPIAHELKGQILSILGVLLSAVIALSSTTLVGNAMAGIMLRLMHEFRAGDFIEIEDMIGRVTDFGIFHTEIQTITRDVVSLPNLLLVSKAVKVTRRGGTFINVAVSIGYDVPHGAVEDSLRKAAESIGLKDSFVFVERLLDHAVVYRLYGLLEEFSERLSKTSELNKAVLDTLHADDIEINSPSMVDRREFPIDHRYMPLHVASKEPPAEEEAAIEEMAFDKAEEAESIEQLRREEKKLVEKLGDNPPQGGKKPTKTQREAIERKIDQIQTEISTREEEQQEKKQSGQ